MVRYMRKARGRSQRTKSLTTFLLAMPSSFGALIDSMCQARYMIRLVKSSGRDLFKAYTCVGCSWTTTTHKDIVPSEALPDWDAGYR